MSTTTQPAGLRPGAFRTSAIQLLAALGLLIFTSPFVEDLPSGDMIEAALLTLVMVFAVLAAGVQRRTLIISVMLAIPAVVGRWLNRVRPDLVPPVVFAIAAILFFAFVVAQLIRFILRAPRVDANVICAGLSGYLMLGVLWLPAYVATARLNPAAFTMAAPGATMDGFNAFYFSFITLSTVGYGDVAPASKVARMLAVTEAIIGLFYMTVLVSRLVAIYSSPQPAPPAADDSASQQDQPNNDFPDRAAK